ncbi:HAMP domain-containing sensor histidine kinase [Mesorhizobium sp. M6A.T.Cr.TU.017.01.1.1]|uniref:sensor histidine kinase n=1 Tax=Mesorhizobium sp. M6A.T.Cr.TU.017.01.1.1 TaxID=2496774 RepID=UPI0013E2D970|nr:HAMP domain-containing sensor histidine kinase [Mesorhizobium sp. M6A.T.Cr.TU.017.01.1.1]
MTRKLILWLSGATLLVWVSVLTIVGLSLSEAVNRLSDESLVLGANHIEPALIHALKEKWPPSCMPGPAHSFDGYWVHREQIRTRDGRVLMSWGEVLPKPLANAPRVEGFWQTATERVYTLEIQPDVFLDVAQPLELRRQTVELGVISVLLLIITLLPVGIAVWWVVIRRSLRPIEVLRQEIGSRDGGNLSPMGLSDLPAELAPIAGSVDRLLERLRTALDAEREFAANSAHELRTPIAGSLAQMQRLVADLPQGSAKIRARGIEKALSSLGHLVEKVLQLARAESGTGMADHAIDLVRSVRLECEDLGKKPQYAGRLRLNVAGCPTLMRKVNVDAFGILLRNLIENALIHGLATVPTTVSVQTDGTIAIANAGPVVPLPDLEGLTKRFSRGATPAAGSGLGLHIANMVIQRIGGSLELASPARGRNDGFEAIIRIPQ